MLTAHTSIGNLSYVVNKNAQGEEEGRTTNAIAIRGRVISAEFCERLLIVEGVAEANIFAIQKIGGTTAHFLEARATQNHIGRMRVGDLHEPGNDHIGGNASKTTFVKLVVTLVLDIQSSPHGDDSGFRGADRNE